MNTFQKMMRKYKMGSVNLESLFTPLDVDPVLLELVEAGCQQEKSSVKELAIFSYAPVPFDPVHIEMLYANPKEVYRVSHKKRPKLDARGW